MELKQEKTQMEITEDARNYKVTKSNALIQKTRFNLSLLEQKIIAYLCARIEPTDAELRTYTFDIQEFCEICGINTDGMYSNLKEVTQKLADKSFWFSPSASEEVLLRWISAVRYNKKHGSITISISDDMRPFLLELKSRFTTYHLFNILAFKSGYSVRMYELLKSFANLAVWTVNVNELKKKLNAEQYGNYKDFRIRVIDIAQREINKFADINFTYEAIAKGRKIDRIVFTITPDRDNLARFARISEVLDHK